MDVTGLPSAHSAAAAKPGRDPLDASRNRDLYAAWREIFDQAKPAAVAPARAGAGIAVCFPQASAADAPSQERVDAAHAPVVQALPASATARDEGGVAPPAGPTRTSERVPLINEALPGVPQHALDERGEPARNVAVRIHYVRSAGADAHAQLPSEAVSVVLSGNQVSIIVRDTGLDEGAALRAAFQTARELTGRPTSLRQLTLNGRLLYSDPRPTNAASADDGVLFSC